MTIPCAHELALGDSNRIMNSRDLRIKMKSLTIHQLRNLLHPQKLVEVFKSLAPFMWGILHTFCASPNRYRTRYAADVAAAAPGLEEDDPMADAGEDENDDWPDDPNLESGEGDPDKVPPHWSGEYAGFSRNPVFVILLTLSMLAFVRNRATNVLPLLLGLFFKISGTSSRVILMLSNAGVCVSGETIERLKVRISEDAVRLAVELITSGQVFFTIFDNINIFLRKSQQRLSNTNDMINATNCAIIGINGVEPLTAADLEEKLKLRGNRSKAQPSDILPTPRTTKFEWKDRKDIAVAVAEMMPLDRPQPPIKTDARPFGVFDVNEGSKKGVVKVLQSVQERSTLSQKIWSSISRIFVGDWLTSNNLRAARRDRTDDVNAMERLEYADELIEDPASLAAHKGLLNRKWDVNKPNYAAAKSLIRHSLIARILHCVMYVQ
ncbi:hypothetical protein B0H10DRAFT_2446077 [Mycena sp. CBHHK59/15]|nr:hypothetical protein B0H10DRAFT_2446077 [Mycena sp. CBHHK59/15]